MKNRKFLLRILIPTLCILISSAFIPWGIVGMRLTPLADTVQEEIERSSEKNGLDGIIVYSDYGDQEVLLGAGWKNRDLEVKAGPDDLFKIASISKLYLASATAKLVNEGVLSLDDSLADLLPTYADWVEGSDVITLAMLVQHRSGIPDFIDLKEYPWGDLPSSNEENLMYVKGMDLEFEPNERYGYSNTNYVLIGEIINLAIGYDHQQYIKDEILKPLGLEDTYGSLEDAPIDQVMSGYYVDYPYDIRDNDFIGYNGAMVATVKDVGIFLRALNDGSMLTKKEQAIYSDIYKYEHTGDLPGYLSIARYDQDSDAVLILFVNTSGGDSWYKVELLYKRLLRIINKS